MRIVKAGFQILKEATKTKLIERIARICYKSEDKIGEGTDKKMIDNLLKRKHLAMLEHADAVFEVSAGLYGAFKRLIHLWTGEEELVSGNHQKSYLRLTRTITDKYRGTVRYIISGNFRAWYELVEWMHTDLLTSGDIPQDVEKVLPYINLSVGEILTPFLTYMSEADKEEYVSACAFKHLIREIKDMAELTKEERMVHERFSVLFTCDRGISHELVRMRESSLAQESTRYVNYAKAKYGSEIAVIDPFFFADNPEAYDIWSDACADAEKYYMQLINRGIPAQKARTVLPHSTKVEIVMTANLAEWKHIFELRACDLTGPAHPQMKEIMIPLLEEAKPVWSFAFGDLTSATMEV